MKLTSDERHSLIPLGMGSSLLLVNALCRSFLDDFWQGFLCGMALVCFLYAFRTLVLFSNEISGIMAIVKPFKGIRPPKELVEQVASRPYDVLNSAEAREEAKGNEKSLYHIIKPEIDFPEGTDEHDPRVYDKAVENFEMFQKKRWLVQDEKPCYYIYAQTMNGKTQYGLVVGAYVPDYMNGVIKKHELTRRDKEEDRMKHVRVNNANIEPVFFAYPESKVLDAIVAKYTAQKPVYDFVAPDDGFGHQFWVIDDDTDIEAVTEAFKEMPSLYIADGHHRSAAAALVGAEKAAQNPNHRGDEEYNYFMAVCFPAEQLTIIDYNRVVKDLNGLTPAQFLEALKKNFVVEEKERIFINQLPCITFLFIWMANGTV